jgi:hypothetical protein
MFNHWDSFYLLVGGAAGALIGLLFIVMTLIRGGDADRRLRGAAIFMTPTVVHLSMVLVLSALATAPGLKDHTTGLIFGACALACLGFTGRALFMLTRRSVQTTHWTDLWAYGVAPFSASLALGLSTAAIWIAPEWAALGVAASVIAMLLIAIRNAWDLVTWLSPTQPPP